MRGVEGGMPAGAVDMRLSPVNVLGCTDVSRLAEASSAIVGAMPGAPRKDLGVSGTGSVRVKAIPYQSSSRARSSEDLVYDF